jgi:hypothetical protein
LTLPSNTPGRKRRGARVSAERRERPCIYARARNRGRTTISARMAISPLLWRPEPRTAASIRTWLRSEQKARVTLRCPVMFPPALDGCRTTPAWATESGGPGHWRRSHRGSNADTRAIDGDGGFGSLCKASHSGHYVKLPTMRSSGRSSPRVVAVCGSTRIRCQGASHSFSVSREANHFNRPRRVLYGWAMGAP